MRWSRTEQCMQCQCNVMHKCERDCIMYCLYLAQQKTSQIKFHFHLSMSLYIIHYTHIGLKISNFIIHFSLVFNGDMILCQYHNNSIGFYSARAQCTIFALVKS